MDSESVKLSVEEDHVESDSLIWERMESGYSERVEQKPSIRYPVAYSSICGIVSRRDVCHSYSGTGSRLSLVFAVGSKATPMSANDLIRSLISNGLSCCS